MSSYRKTMSEAYKSMYLTKNDTLKPIKEEVELDEGTSQVLAHGGKGQYKVTSGGGVTTVKFKGKVVSSGDFDQGADGWFMNIKGEKGQKFFDTAQDMADYFAKNKITEEVECDCDCGKSPCEKCGQDHHGIAEEVGIDEASKEGTIKIIKTKDGKFQIQKMTKGKFVDMGKPYNSAKEAEKFRSGQPDLFGEASARADAMRAMRKGKSIDPADVDNVASDDDVKAASKNIMMQLRKSVNRASRGVEFGDKKKVQVDPKIAQAVISKYNSLRRPSDKEIFQAKIAKSYKDMLKALKESTIKESKFGIINKQLKGEK